MNLDVNTLFMVTIYVEAILGLLLLFAWAQNMAIRAVAWWGFAHLIRAASVVLFGIILKAVGMLIAGFLLVVLSSMGNPEKFQTRDVLFLAVGLVVFCALVFVWGLKLPLPLCPDIESLQSAIKFCRG